MTRWGRPDRRGTQPAPEVVKPQPFLTTSGKRAVEFAALCRAGFPLQTAFDFADAEICTSDLLEMQAWALAVVAAFPRFVPSVVEDEK